MKTYRLAYALLPLLVLTGCQPESQSSTLEQSTPPIQVDYDGPSARIEIFRESTEEPDECYIDPRNVTLAQSYSSLSGILSNNQSVCPSIGEVSLLVIPVHLPGETHNTAQVRSDIEKAFFGKEGDNRLGYPSLSSFYQTSSFGKLRFQGEVTDWFDVAEHTDIRDSSRLTTDGTSPYSIQTILREAVDWAISTQGIDIDDYDYNDDGYIDGVWLVYDKLDTYTENAIKGTTNFNNVFWNMSSCDYDAYKDEAEIERQLGWGRGTSSFSWASFSSLYTPYADYDGDIPDLCDLSSIPVSSHTFVHETGHLLGLEDYYAIDSAAYRPAGQFTMMDQNVGDFDSYSKMVLGWVTPYVAYGPSSIELLSRFHDDKQVIVVPADYASINDEVERQTALGVASEDIKIEFNPFSEYLLLDLYSPESLDELDILRTPHDRRPGPSETGVRLYHVDSRLFRFSVIAVGSYTDIIFDPEDYLYEGGELRNNEYAALIVTNSVGTGNIDIDSYLGEQLGISFNAFDQLRLIPADGFDDYSLGQPMDGDDLFQAGDKFDIKQFGMVFFSDYRFNSGNNLPFAIEITDLQEGKE